MAKIEMDISEYEIMRENKKLLEDSLKKERELQNKIEELNKEKIKALEDAKMKVVKISRSETTEYILVKKQITDIYREMSYFFHSRDIKNIYGHSDIDRLIEIFFQKTKSYSTKPTEEIITYGLDEIKLEIENDLKNKLDKETKVKLEDAELSISKYNELKRENTKLNSENKNIFEKYEKLLEENNKLVKELDESLEVIGDLNNNIIDINKKNDKIKDILKNGYGMWNKAEKLNEIMGLLKNA